MHLHFTDAYQLKVPSGEPENITGFEAGDKVFFNSAQVFSGEEFDMQLRVPDDGAYGKPVAHSDRPVLDFIHAVGVQQLPVFIISLQRITACGKELQHPVPLLVADAGEAESGPDLL